MNVKGDALVVDKVMGYYSITNDPQLGRHVVKVFQSGDEFWRELTYLVMSPEVNEVINGGVETAGAPPRLKQLLGAMEIDVLDKIKERHGYPVAPGDLSPKVREIMNKMSHPDYRPDELATLFEERARVLQGLRNLL